MVKGSEPLYHSGTKLVRINGAVSVSYVVVGSDIECWGVMGTTGICEVCMGELTGAGTGDVVSYSIEKSKR